MPRAEQGRGLRAVVFLDTVGSTQIAAALGDERWQTLLRRELQILRGLLKERSGREVDVAGDGLFALFDEPAAAVRFAASAAEAVREIGVEIRAGVHFGEVEFSDGHPAGIVVHTGARAMGLGEAGQVIVTQTVRDLVTGGHLRFTDHGTHELKGIPGSWSLHRLTEIDREQVAPPLDEQEASSRREQASEPTPLVKRRTFLAVVGAAAVAGSVATYLVTRKEETGPTTVLGGHRVFRYDVAADDLTMLPAVFGSTGVDFFPSIAVGEGGVWTGDFYLHHIDPDDGSVADPIPLSSGNSDFVVALTTGFDDVWAVTSRGLHRIDPGDDEELRFRPLPIGGFQAAIVTGFESVWVALLDGGLIRLEPTGELRIIEELRVGQVLSGVVKARDAIWVSDEFGELIPVDPEGNRVGRGVLIGGGPKALAATEDRLWAVNPDSHDLIVMDFETRTPSPIDVGGEPIDLATGLESVWVADLQGRLIQVDAGTRQIVKKTDVEGPVAAVAVDEAAGVVWLRTTHR